MINCLFKMSLTFLKEKNLRRATVYCSDQAYSCPCSMLQKFRKKWSLTPPTTLELTGDVIIHVTFCLEWLIMLAYCGNIFSQFDYNFLGQQRFIMLILV